MNVDIMEYRDIDTESINVSRYVNCIIQGDCLEIMRKMPDKSIYIIITSPPYNLLNSTGNGLKKKY